MCIKYPVLAIEQVWAWQLFCQVSQYACLFFFFSKPKFLSHYRPLVPPYWSPEFTCGDVLLCVKFPMTKHCIMGPGLHSEMLLFFFSFRTVQKIRQVSISWPGQCWQNDATAHAQRWQIGTACANFTSKWVGATYSHTCTSTHARSVLCWKPFLQTNSGRLFTDVYVCHF